MQRKFDTPVFRLEMAEWIGRSRCMPVDHHPDSQSNGGETFDSLFYGEKQNDLFSVKTKLEDTEDVKAKGGKKRMNITMAVRST